MSDKRTNDTAVTPISADEQAEKLTEIVRALLIGELRKVESRLSGSGMAQREFTIHVLPAGELERLRDAWNAIQSFDRTGNLGAVRYFLIEQHREVK